MLVGGHTWTQEAVQSCKVYLLPTGLSLIYLIKGSLILHGRPSLLPLNISNAFALLIRLFQLPTTSLQITPMITLCSLFGRGGKDSFL